LAQFLIANVDHIFERQLLGLKRMQDAFRILQLQILQPLRELSCAIVSITSDI
jgi:hypothetical protein